MTIKRKMKFTQEKEATPFQFLAIHSPKRKTPLASSIAFILALPVCCWVSLELLQFQLKPFSMQILHEEGT